jgi:hypothetical protein
MNDDFKFFVNYQRIEISINGWYNPLLIEHGLTKISEQVYLNWRVIGTEHIFRVPLKVVTSKHGSKYEDHFKITLIKFKEDLIQWYNEGLPEDWMREYFRQFRALIHF